MFSKDKLKEIRLLKGCSQTKIADFLGVTRSAYSSWETGIYQPNKKNLLQLSEFFNVAPSYFEHDYEIVHKYLRLNTKNQQKLIDTANQLFYSQLVSYQVHARLSAGPGDFYLDNEDFDTVYFDEKFNYDIASWIHGNSMEPTYHNGDVALIEASGFDYNGLVYALVYEGKTYIKKVYVESDQIRLVSINEEYEDMILPIDEVRIVGPVLKSFTPIEA